MPWLMGTSAMLDMKPAPGAGTVCSELLQAEEEEEKEEEDE